MKYFYILIAIVFFVSGFYYFAGPPNRVAEPQPEEIEIASEPLPINDGEEPPLEEPKLEPSDEEDLLPGSDVGMEFPIPDEGVELEAKVFNLDSFSFGYDVTEIEVEEGDTVTINLTVSDGFHNWVVDEFEAATEKIRPGGLSSVTFVADKAGVYEFYCSVGNHRALGMVGTLIVH